MAKGSAFAERSSEQRSIQWVTGGVTKLADFTGEHAKHGRPADHLYKLIHLQLLQYGFTSAQRRLLYHSPLNQRVKQEVVMLKLVLVLLVVSSAASLQSRSFLEELCR